MSPTSAFLTFLARLTRLALRCLLAVVVAAPALFAFTPAPPAYAAGSELTVPRDPPVPGGDSTDPTLDEFQARLLEMTKTVIKLILFLSVIVMAIAVPKGALAAKVNNLFGSAMGVSHAWMNVLAAVVAGGVTLMSMPLVDMVFKLFVPTGNILVKIPVPGF